MDLTTVQKIAVSILPLIFAITVHEVSHGYVAYLLGDNTAKFLGRLTLNPIKHIDLVGTIIVPIVLSILGSVILGWAKPVPVDGRNLRNPRRDFALIAAAGPLSNLVMAFIWGGIAKIGSIMIANFLPGALAIYMMGMMGIGINLMLMILNLLPIPQLDGGHVLASLLPRSIAHYYERASIYGLFILFILLAIGVLDIVIRPAVNFFFALIAAVYHL